MLLKGAVVQRVDASPGVFAIQVRVPRETVTIVLVAGAGASSGLGLLTPEERRRIWEGGRLPAGAPKRALPRDLEGARVVAVHPRAVVLATKDGEVAIAIRRGEVALGVSVDGPPCDERERARLFERGAALAQAARDATFEAIRDRARRALDRAAARLARRVEAVRGDLAKMAEADALIATAQWVVAAAARAPRGARELGYDDWTTGEPVKRTLALDPARSALEQVEAMFRRARRLKLGAAFARKRLAGAEQALAIVRRSIDAVGAARETDAIESALASAKQAAPRDVRLDEAAPTPTRKDKQSRRLPYRTFRSGEHRILVGKGASQNEELTLHVAKPPDAWLHTKGRTGAHVVVPLARGKSCPPEVLVDAAHLAAHFSDARGERVVDVTHTSKRYVRKPKGSPAGSVLVDREKVLVLRVEPERLERLLASEET